MMSVNSQKNVMRKVAEYAKKDKAKIQFARISKFGLMELSRQKLKSSIIQNNYENCPTCDGTGQIKSLSSLAISILRIIEEEAINSKNKETVYLPVRLATYLLNEKKDTIKNIESRHNVEIKIVPDPDLDTSSYEIDNEGLEESEFKKKLKSNQKDNKKNKNSDTADGMIIQDKEVALMSAVKPKTSPPRPSRNYSSSKDKQPEYLVSFLIYYLVIKMKRSKIINLKGTTIEIEDTIRTLSITSINQIIRKVSQEIADKKIIKGRA